MVRGVWLPPLVEMRCIPQLSYFTLVQKKPFSPYSRTMWAYIQATPQPREPQHDMKWLLSVCRLHYITLHYIT